MKIKTKTIISTLSLLLFIAIATIVVLIARGFVFDFDGKKLDKTGIIVVNTEPKGVEIYIDDQLINVSNTTISNLQPKTYKLKLVKEGYSTWEKEIVVEENVVDQIDTKLFQLSPSLTPLTLYGPVNPQTNSDGSKIAYLVKDNGDKNGLWILTMNNLPFGKGYDSKQILKDTDQIKYSSGELVWSPDDKELMITLNQGEVTNSYLISSDDQNDDPATTVSNREETLNRWTEEDKKLRNDKFTNFNDEDQIYFKQFTEISWAPDQQLFYYTSQGYLEFYDLEKKKILVSNIKPEDFENISWYPYGNRLIVTEKANDQQTGTVSAIDIDGSNKVSIYEGILLSDKIFISPNGQRLFFLANYNTANSKSPNLYYINL